MSRNGSALLAVIIIMFVLIGVVSQYARVTSLLLDMVVKKMVHEQRVRLTEGLMQYAIALCVEHYQEIAVALTKKQELRGMIDPWPPNSAMQQQNYQGIMVIQKKADDFFIKAALMEQGVSRCMADCLLTRSCVNCSTRYVIHDWHST